MKTSVELVPQPHGGALLSGGVPGHTGGPGRPSNAIRSVLRGNLGEVIPKLHEQWQAGTIDDIQYAEYLSKYAIGPMKGVSDAELDAFATQLAGIVFEECGPELFQRVSARLAEIRHPHDDAA